MLLENNFNPLCHIMTSGAKHRPAFTIYQEMTFSHKNLFLYDFKVQTYLFFTVNPIYCLDTLIGMYLVYLLPTYLLVTGELTD